MIAGALRPLVVLLLIAWSGATAAAGQAPASDTPFAVRYRELVDAYRGGDTAAPVGELLALDGDRLADLVDRYARLWQRGVAAESGIDDAFFRAAAMLHAEAAVRCWDERLQETGRLQIELARRLVDVSQRPGAPPGSFRHRWYAATALLAASRVSPPDVIDYFEDAIRKLPGDAALLTAAGWFQERLAEAQAPAGMSLAAGQTRRRRYQQDAMRVLRAALAADPNAAEAALRLARVEVDRGELTAARQRLERLAARDDLQPLLAYVARLLLAGVEEREGKPGEAERRYREAIALDPVAQSARVALGRLLHAGGDTAGAAAIVEPAVTERDARSGNDPWGDYRLGYPAIGQLVFDALRDEVQR
ncbi:MAG: tetratricopeptide repeat protein [Vicinamibacterales bacterium]